MERAPKQPSAETRAFLEVFGDGKAYDELQASAKKVSVFLENANVERDGERIRSVTFHVPSNQKEDIQNEFVAMGVHPWTEKDEDGNYNFIIEHEREIKKLEFLQLVSSPEPTLAGSEETSADESIEHDPYSFPLPDVPTTERPRPNRQTSRIVDQANDEVQEVDTYMQTAEESFSQGLDIEAEAAIQPEFRYSPNLKGFKQEYFFKNGEISDVHGNEIPYETYKQILLEAKDDPEKMEQAVKMSTGLVITVLKRVLDKFGPNSVVTADDLFQAGMEGLVVAIRRYEDRETRPSSYFVPYIEGYIRTYLSVQKEGYARKPNDIRKIATYQKAVNTLVGKDPYFNNLPSNERELLIAEETGFSLAEVRKTARQTGATSEEYDDDVLEHNREKEEDLFIDLESIDYSKLQDAITENLESVPLREELAVRLYFGLTGPGRWRNEDVQNELLGGDNTSIRNGSYQELLKFDPQKDSLRDLNSAEQMFLAVIGKIPESAVAELHLNDPEKPTSVSLEEIGKIFGTRRERPRQLIAKGLRQLKHPGKVPKLVKTGYVKKVREKRKNWQGDTVEHTKHTLEGENE
ncbi:MAG: sigma-70 family RNA polymerase sigma factor [Candidatus Paceibacterota bacterium]